MILENIFGELNGFKKIYKIKILLYPKREQKNFQFIQIMDFLKLKMNKERNMRLQKK